MSPPLPTVKGCVGRRSNSCVSQTMRPCEKSGEQAPNLARLVSSGTEIFHRAAAVAPKRLCKCNACMDAGLWLRPRGGRRECKAHALAGQARGYDSVCVHRAGKGGRNRAARKGHGAESGGCSGGGRGGRRGRRAGCRCDCNREHRPRQRASQPGRGAGGRVNECMLQRARRWKRFLASSPGGCVNNGGYPAVDRPSTRRRKQPSRSNSVRATWLHA